MRRLPFLLLLSTILFIISTGRARKLERAEREIYVESERQEEPKSEPTPNIPRDFREALKAEFMEFGEDTAEILVAVAWCESRFLPDAVNNQSGCKGLFQFSDSTFLHYGVGNIYDNYSQIQAVKRMIKELGVEGALRHWSSSAHCWEEK